jgi:Glyoxalase-like domain
MPLTLDHAGVVGRDMATLRSAWQRLGFAPTAPRELMAGQPGHSDYRSLGQSSCHIVLERGYIELSAVHGRDPAHHLAPWSARGDGLQIVAFGAEDIDAQQQACQFAALPVTATSLASRRIEYGERHGDARFRWFMVHAAATPEALVCYVRNETPELVYQAAVQRHPNGAQALIGLRAVVSDLKSARARWSKMLSRAPDSALPDGWRWQLEDGASFDLLSLDGSKQRFTLDPRQCSFADRVVSVVVKVADLEAAARLLGANDVHHTRNDSGLIVDPAAACGAVLELQT